MKRLRIFSKSAVFGLLLALFFCWGLSAQSATADTTETNIFHLTQQSNQQTSDNYNDNSTLQTTRSNVQLPLLLNQDNPWEDLRNWIDKGLKGLDESAQSLTMLENQLTELKAENKAQESLLKQSQELLTFLKAKLAEAQTNVDIANDRMQDAENYAQYIDAQNILLKQEAARLKKTAPVGFVFGSVSFGAGVPLVVEGIRSDNKTMLWSGVGIIGVGSLVWVTGHYIFQWW